VRYNQRPAQINNADYNRPPPMRAFYLICEMGYSPNLRGTHRTLPRGRAITSTKSMLVPGKVLAALAAKPSCSSTCPNAAPRPCLISDIADIAFDSPALLTLAFSPFTQFVTTRCRAARSFLPSSPCCHEAQTVPSTCCYRLPRVQSLHLPIKGLARRCPISQKHYTTSRKQAQAPKQNPPPGRG